MREQELTLPRVHSEGTEVPVAPSRRPDLCRTPGTRHTQTSAVWWSQEAQG